MRHVDSIQLCNVQFHPLQPDARPDYFFDDVLNVDTSGVCSTSSIKEATHIGQVRIFPSPCRDEITVLPVDMSPSGMKVEVLDVQGGVVMEIFLESGNNTVSTALLYPGVYFVSVQVDGRRFSGRFVKQ